MLFGVTYTLMVFVIVTFLPNSFQLIGLWSSRGRVEETKERKKRLQMRGVKSQVILTEKEQKDVSLPPEIDSNLLLKSFSAGNRLQIQNFLKRSPPFFFREKKKFFLCVFSGKQKRWVGPCNWTCFLKWEDESWKEAPSGKEAYWGGVNFITLRGTEKEWLSKYIALAPGPAQGVWSQRKEVKSREGLTGKKHTHLEQKKKKSGSAETEIGSIPVCRKLDPNGQQSWMIFALSPQSFLFVEKIGLRHVTIICRKDTTQSNMQAASRLQSSSS